MKTQMLKQIFGLLGIGTIIFVLGWIDWQTGYKLNFFVFYFIPIIIAAWYYGIEWTIAFSIISALIWYLADKLSGHSYSSNIFLVWNTLIRLSSFIIIGLSVCRINDLLESEQTKTASLKKALLEINMRCRFPKTSCDLQADSGYSPGFGHWLRCRAIACNAWLIA